MRANGEPGHRRDVEGPVDDRRQPSKTPAFAEYAAIPDVADQHPVEASDDIPQVRSGGLSLGERDNHEQQSKAKGCKA